jgi:hypothetical protein
MVPFGKQKPSLIALLEILDAEQAYLTVLKSITSHRPVSRQKSSNQ